MRLRRQSDKSPVIIDTREPLGKGGEAHVFAIAGEPQMAAKLYEPDQDLQERALKLAIMRDAPPDLPASSAGHIPIAWPTDLLCDPQDGRLVGFLMPRVHDATQIIDYYNPRARLQHCPLFDYRYLMATARNLAAAVRAVHARGYVIGDLKHSNVLVTPTALVTLIDTDSFQVRDPQSERIYACTVRTPDFTPPELQDGRLAPSVLTPEQDLFALAVLIFHLLMEGTHPFAGVYEGVGDPPSFEERIAAGHFPYGHHPGPYHPGTRNAPPFMLPAPALQDLFVRCFEEGYADPSARPDATTWQKALDEGKRALVRCAVHERHFYGDHLDRCPWCERMEAQGHGWNPFPARQVMPAVPLLPNGMPAYLEETANLRKSAALPSTRAADAWGVLAIPAALLFALFGGIMLSNSTVNTHPAVQVMPPSPFIRYDEGYAQQYWASHWSRPDPPEQIYRSGVPIRPVLFSCDGRFVAGGDRSITMWNAASGKVTRRLKGNGETFDVLAFSPDGKRLATGSDNGKVRIWDIGEGKNIQTHVLNGPVASVTFSADGEKLAAVSAADGEVPTVWNAQTGELLQSLWMPSGCHATCLRFSADGTLLAVAITGHMGGHVDLWSTRTHNLLHTLWQSPAPVSLAFSKDSSTLVALGFNPTVWDLETGRIRDTLSPARPLGALMAMSMEGTIVANAGPGTVTVQNTGGGSSANYTTYGQPVSSLALSPDGGTLLFGDVHNGLYALNTQTGERTLTYTAAGE